jgi:hypothetical protein
MFDSNSVSTDLLSFSVISLELPVHTTHNNRFPSYQEFKQFVLNCTHITEACWSKQDGTKAYISIWKKEELLQQWKEFYISHVHNSHWRKLLQDVIKHYFPRNYLQAHMKSMGIRNSDFGVNYTKKKSEGFPSNQVSAGSNDLRVGRKMATFHLFFSVQGTGGSPTGPDPENRVDDQDTGSPGRPVSSGLQVPGEPGHCRARTRPPWEPSACPNLHEWWTQPAHVRCPGVQLLI